jgi:hypothetical protein
MNKSGYGTEDRRSPAETSEWGAQILAMLEASTLLVALVDGEGRLLHANPALRAELGQAPEPVDAFPDLFTGWSRAKVRESALPAVRRMGLWEGGLTLRQSHQCPTVHATLTGSPDPGDDTFLALLMPQFGTAGPGSEDGKDLPDLSSRVAVPLYHETRFLEPATITHLEAQGSYTQVYLEGQTLLTSLPLSSFARALPDAFLRVHRSFLVNVHRVRALVRRENRLFLQLEGDTAAEIPVSRRREARVRAVVDTAQQVFSATR